MYTIWKKSSTEDKSKAKRFTLIAFFPFHHITISYLVKEGKKDLINISVDVFDQNTNNNAAASYAKSQHWDPLSMLDFVKELEACKIKVKAFFQAYGMTRLYNSWLKEREKAQEAA